ncbi:MAG: DNA topoisomerase III [Lachnospirales bacterium]
MSILVIAEKPSVARDIAKVLKVNKKGDGYLYNDEYIISWAIGHLVTLKEPDDYDKSLKKWTKKNLPILPVEIGLKAIPNTKKQFNLLKKLLNSPKVTSIICATDSGREGELIFRYIYCLSNCIKKFERLWISSMTDQAIKDGFKNLKSGNAYDNLYQSAKCRSEADWLVGINATRAYTLTYDSLLSIGRVQTPTLAIIVNRDEEIKNFKSEDYFEIMADFNEYLGKYTKENVSKISTKKEAEEIIKACENKTGIVNNIDVEKKSIVHPQLYDLTELQRECNKRFGYSAKKTLEVAQSLYEKRKYITYPRTDSKYLSDDMLDTINSVINVLSPIFPDYVTYIKNLKKIPITKRIVNNEKINDHHAIIPTIKKFTPESLPEDEKNVFLLIVKRFLACFYPNYIYNITSIITSVENNEFITKGNTIVQLGWMEILQEKTKEDDILPEVKVGEEKKIKKLELLSKKTTPPKPYTEAQLLSSMENAGRFIEDEVLKEQLKENGIGTPATRAAIIERLIQVGYIKRNKKNLIATEKGINLIKVLPNELTSPETTGRWEKGLSKISKGELDPEKFMASISRFVSFIIQSSNKKEDVSFPKKEFNKKIKSYGNCPKCKAGLIHKNSKAYYCSNWKNNCKFNIWKDSLEKYNIEIADEMVIELLENNSYTHSDKEIILTNGEIAVNIK